MIKENILAKLYRKGSFNRLSQETIIEPTEEISIPSDMIAGDFRTAAKICNVQYKFNGKNYSCKGDPQSFGQSLIAAVTAYNTEQESKAGEFITVIQPSPWDIVIGGTGRRVGNKWTCTTSVSENVPVNNYLSSLVDAETKQVSDPLNFKLMTLIKTAIDSYRSGLANSTSALMATQLGNNSAKKMGIVIITQSKDGSGVQCHANTFNTKVSIGTLSQ